MGWPFSVLKYKYFFQIKCTEAISSKFIQQHSEAVMVRNYQNADSIKKIYCVIYYNFLHTFVPYAWLGPPLVTLQ